MRGVSHNLSQGGIQVEVLHLKRKDAVRLTFRLPTSHALVDAAGAVVWVGERRYGIRFNCIGEQSQESIRQFIEQQIGN